MTAKTEKTTAEELAVKCGQMLALRAKLSDALEAAKKSIHALEILRIEDKPFDELEYRSLRNSLGDLRSQMEALSQRIEDLQELGKQAVKADIGLAIERAVAELKALKMEARAEILEKLIPLQAQVHVLRESLTDAGVGVEHEERLKLSREIARLRSEVDKKETIIGKIHAMDNLLGALNRGEYQDFDQMVNDHLAAA